MSTALAVREGGALTLMPAMSIEQAVERYDAMVQYVQRLMKPELDYGAIPGTTKKTLLKPGAEKLTTFFGLSKRFTCVEKTEDWTGVDHGGEPFFYYIYRCSLWTGDILVAESDGSCNSFESKYRYRKGERQCPVCGAASILKSKDEGKGWFCWKKKGGCGATFPENDQDITSQVVGRVSNPDIADQVNTFQKMAQKRALVAATLLAVNASEFFTQDVEDIDTGRDYIDVEPERAATAKQGPKTSHVDPRRSELKEEFRSLWPKTKPAADFNPYFEKKFKNRTVEQIEAALEASRKITAQAQKAAQEQNEAEAAGQVVDAEVTESGVLPEIERHLKSLEQWMPVDKVSSFVMKLTQGEELESCGEVQLQQIASLLRNEIAEFSQGAK